MNLLDVKKLVNYYDVLCDLNINKERLDEVIIQASEDGNVNIQTVVDALEEFV